MDFASSTRAWRMYDNRRVMLSTRGHLITLLLGYMPVMNMKTGELSDKSASLIFLPFSKEVISKRKVSASLKLFFF